MRSIFIYLFIFCFFNSACGQKKDNVDSMARLVHQYFNAKDATRLYELTGEQFRNQLSLQQFSSITSENLFPLGKMDEPQFVSSDNGVSKYKVDFSATTLALYLGLDKKGKLETFLLKEFVDETQKKDQAPSSNAQKTELDKAVDAAVQPYIKLSVATGLSIGIIRKDQMYFYGYGETKKGSSIIPDEHTLFEIGSITKTFTAVLLAGAVNSGKMKLDDPYNKTFSDSLPGLQFSGTPVTLKMLSNHTSAIPRMPGNFDVQTDPLNPYKNYSSSQLFDFYRNLKLERKPGTFYEYSNLAVATLGVVLEHLYQKPYSQLLSEQVFNPLGMKETRQFLRKEDSSKLAWGYDERGVYNGPWDFKAFAAAGAIRSTTSDMLLYARAQLGDAPMTLSKAIELTHAVTFTDGKNKTGLGWHYIRPGVDEVLFHNGGTGGYRSYMAVNPQKKFAVVILSNTAIGAEKVGNDLMKWLEKNQ